MAIEHENDRSFCWSDDPEVLIGEARRITEFNISAGAKLKELASLPESQEEISEFKILWDLRRSGCLIAHNINHKAAQIEESQ